MKMRVIVNGVSFYTTAAKIKQRTVGDDSNLNAALYQLHSNLFNGTSIASTITLYDNKMKKHSFDIQLNKVQS